MRRVAVITGRMLGPVSLLVDGAPAPAELLWRKNLALLVYLIRSPRRARTRDHLIGLLWPNRPDAAARHSLREAVRVLRRCAGEDSVETVGDQVEFRGPAELDVDVLDARCDSGQWADAASLVAGEFMEGFSVPDSSAFEEWLAAERLAWRRRSIEALVGRANDQLSCGDALGGSGTALRAVELDPLSEPATEIAVRCLALAGDRARALERYEVLVSGLSDAGVEPSGDVQALAERVRQGRSWRVPAHLVPERAEGALVRRAPLIGREAELSDLLRVWAGVRDRCRAGVGVVLGDSGVGKTRVVEELVERVRLDGAATSVTRAVPADRAEAWSGILGLVRGLSDTAGLAAAEPAALAAFVPHAPAMVDRFGERLRGVTALSRSRAFSEAAAALCGEGPLVLAIDDAQWLDDDSLAAIAATLRDRAGDPLFVLLATTPQPPSGLDLLRAHVGRDQPGGTIELAPLSEAALRRLARWALPRYSDGEIERVARRVLADSAGLPLLAVELLHAIAAGLDVAGSETAAWPQPLRTLDQTLPGDLPDAVVAAIRVGFRRLSAEAQQVLTALSLMGDRSDGATTGWAAGLSGQNLHAALDELEWQRWVTADTRGYGFVARIVREVVARDMLTPGQRQRLLERIAERTPNAS